MAETFQSALALSWCVTEATCADPLERSVGRESDHQQSSPQCHWSLGTPLPSHLCYSIGSNAINKAQRSNAAKQEETQDQSHCVQCVPWPDKMREIVLLSSN